MHKSEKKQEKYYDEVAELYDTHHSDKYAMKYRYYVFDKILRGIDFKGLLCLDAMAGGGEQTDYLLSKGGEVIGLDISKECCDIYKKKFPNCKIIKASILNSKIKDNTFDVIITDSLHHLHPNVDKCIKEICRILKPNGYFCFWEVHTGSIPDLIRKVWYKKDKKFFEENESSIDLNKLEKDNEKYFDFRNKFYGGNLAYIFVSHSMILRIPPGLKKYYAPILIGFERMFSWLFNFKYISCYVMCLWQKK